MYKVESYINGQSSSESNNSGKIYNPSYGTEIGEVLYSTNDVATRLSNLHIKPQKLGQKLD